VGQHLLLRLLMWLAMTGKENNMNITFEPNELQFVMSVLADLPTKSNVWPLLRKLEEQIKAQTPAEPAEAANVVQ